MSKIPENHCLLCFCGHRCVVEFGKEGYYYCKKCKEFLIHYYFDERLKDFVLSQDRSEEQHSPIYI